MHVRASEKRLELATRFDTPVPETIQTDPTRLRQVLINLLGNAIKFTEQGSVTLAIQFVEQPRPAIEFLVMDTGIGMSDEQQRRLFKPFSQGDASVTREYGGSGLGLAISQRLVSMLGGRLTAESELGKGSTFRVLLPVEATSGVAIVQLKLDENFSEHDDVVTEPRRLHGRVLVVDDRRDVRHISQHFLEKAGATVATAEDGQQGFDAAIAARNAAAPFDLILMDMQMPNVDGLQAAAELRSAGIECPIIALTADAMKSDRERCLNGGCDDYLAKPIDQAKLIEMVGRYTLEFSIDELRTRRQERAAATKVNYRQPE
jgi:CheY-like chemotaxis protein/anti-sigma regulatory factor (Ser/Thr protein kinase)